MAGALRQSTLAFREALTIAFAFAAAISEDRKAVEVVVGFFVVGIAAKDEMHGVVTAGGQTSARSRSDPFVV